MAPPSPHNQPGRKAARKIPPIVSDHESDFWQTGDQRLPSSMGVWRLFFVQSSAHLCRAMKLCLSSPPRTFQASLIRFALYAASY